jgi:hypothetical protein
MVRMAEKFLRAIKGFFSGKSEVQLFYEMVDKVKGGEGAN